MRRRLLNVPCLQAFISSSNIRLFHPSVRFVSVNPLTMNSQLPPTLSSARHLLQTRFGHKTFRPGQQRTIEHILSDPSNPSSPSIPPYQTGRALAIFPTGAGKSLCYQLPAILLYEGLTLVVSPLMALMRDQAEGLVRQGFDAATLDSSLSAVETRELYERIREGGVRILFVSPERFKNIRFLNAIRKVSVALFVVDEAHCISEWGHSFRPDYLRLARWANRLSCQRRLALSATASPKVAKDVCERLGIPWEEGVVRLPAVRKELTTRVTAIEENGGGIEERVGILVQRLRERETGPTIVYVTLQKSAETVANELRKRGFLSAACYHGGMKAEERKAVQDAFMSNMVDGIVVGTIAFGLGLDHPSVRYVYHLNLPKSLEGYIQEIGRAGRDGKAAVCETLACVDDISTLEGFCFAETPSLASVEGLVRDLLEGTSQGDSINFSMYDLGFKHDIRDTCMGQILAQLDLSEGLMEENTPFFAEIVCKMSEGRNAFPPPSTQAGEILLLSDVKRINIVVNVMKAAKHLNIEHGKVSRIIDDLVIEGRLETASPRKMMYTAFVERTPTDLKAVAKRMHEALLRTQQMQLRQIAQVVEYLGADECQSIFLQKHLGDDVKGTRSCGHCEFCLNGGSNPVEISADVRRRAKKILDERRWALIQADPTLPRDNPLLLARFAAGISSPIISRKYRRIATYGSMADHDFRTLLKTAEEECGVKV